MTAIPNRGRPDWAALPVLAAGRNMARNMEDPKH